MTTPLAKQLSDALAQVTEQRDAAKTKLTYTENSLAMAQAQIALLRAQVSMHEDAQNVRQAGDKLETPTSTNPFTTFGGSQKSTEETTPNIQPPEFN